MAESHPSPHHHPDHHHDDMKNLWRDDRMTLFHHVRDVSKTLHKPENHLVKWPGNHRNPFLLTLMTGQVQIEMLNHQLLHVIN